MYVCKSETVSFLDKYRKLEGSSSKVCRKKNELVLRKVNKENIENIML